jgi:hypothetical protein
VKTAVWNFVFYNLCCTRKRCVIFIYIIINDYLVFHTQYYGNWPILLGREIVLYIQTTAFVDCCIIFCCVLSLKLRLKWYIFFLNVSVTMIINTKITVYLNYFILYMFNLTTPFIASTVTTGNSSEYIIFQPELSLFTCCFIHFQSSVLVTFKSHQECLKIEFWLKEVFWIKFCTNGLQCPNSAVKSLVLHLLLLLLLMMGVNYSTI